MARREEEEAEDLQNGNMGELEDNMYNGSMGDLARREVHLQTGDIWDLARRVRRTRRQGRPIARQTV